MIVNPGQINNFKSLLGDGSRYGIDINYKIQDKPRGLPDAFILGKTFINKENVALILGDNFFYGQSLTRKLEKSSTHKSGATIFLKEVSSPENYGVAKINKNKIEKIIEKPKKYVSNNAITGLYFFDKNVVKLSKTLKSNKELTYRVLAQIASSVPTRVRFDKVDYNGGSLITIQGIAASDQDILKFIENLGKQQLIDQASLSSMRLPQRTQGGATMKGFRVFVKIKNV